VYVFSESEAVKKKFLERTASGTLVFNDTVMQLALQQIPLSAQGESGYGGYLGKTSFDTYTHVRGFVNIPIAAEPHLQFRYPPYSEETYNAIAGIGMRRPIPEA